MAERSAPDRSMGAFERLRASGDIVAGIAITAALLGGGVALRQAQRKRDGHISGAPLVAPAAVDLPFGLLERASQVGLRFTHAKFTPHKSLASVAPGLCAQAGASVAVADVDRDGWPDVYLTNAALGSKNALFHNNHDGTFSEIGDRAGIADLNQTASSLRALFFDYDNDGFDDLLLNTTWCPRLFHNRGDGTFEDVTRDSGLTACNWVQASNVVDYDGDGLLDIITGEYFQPVDVFNPARTDFLPTNITPDDGGGAIHVYHNEGHGKFREVPDRLGIRTPGWTQTIGVYDLFGHGRQDLYFGVDFNYDQAYAADGHGGFVSMASHFAVDKPQTFSMSAEIADVDNDGLPAVLSTGTYEPNHAPGNGLFKLTPEGRLRESARRVGVAECGWAWGAKFLDLDNDTHQDLVVTNGYISANPERDFWYEQGLLNSGNSEIQRDARRTIPMEDASLAGYQTKCVFYNTGATMKDVSSSTDLGHDRSDGRGLAAIDFRNEGLLSIVESTVAAPARFFLNVPRHHNHWIGFDLTGTRSNRDAFGTSILIRLHGGTTLTRESEPANGFESESDHRVLFGLGPDPLIDSIRIRWPLGTVQELGALDMDRYHALTEPR